MRWWGWSGRTVHRQTELPWASLSMAVPARIRARQSRQLRPCLDREFAPERREALIDRRLAIAQ